MPPAAAGRQARPARIASGYLRRNPVCLQRYRHVVARKRQHGLTTTLIYATTPRKGIIPFDPLDPEIKALLKTRDYPIRRLVRKRRQHDADRIESRIIAGWFNQT
ncbi:hypothetical protein [Ralstonia solanacearum]|uniref:hypothetical protein n=1 Tax=Ralstonia solanacearum TaxID=305 RepID=UPI000F621440|nr:hypothetical protein [Ralstonia solanacearum]